MPFLVVEFQGNEKDSVIEAVPKCWVKEDGTCHWPDHLRKKPNYIRKLVNQQSQPDEQYTFHQVKIIKEFEKIDEARLFAKKMEKGRESSSQSLGKGKRKKYKADDRSDFTEYSDSTDTTSISMDMDNITDEETSENDLLSSENAIHNNTLAEIYSQDLLEENLSPNINSERNSKAIKQKIAKENKKDSYKKNLFPKCSKVDYGELSPDLILSKHKKVSKKDDAAQNEDLCRSNLRNETSYERTFVDLQPRSYDSRDIINATPISKNLAPVSTNSSISNSIKSIHKDLLKDNFKAAVMKWFKSAPQRLKKSV